MIDLRFSPLNKPVPLPPQVRSAPFKISFTRLLDDLERELRYLGAAGIVVEADCERKHIRNDGWLFADTNPRTPGIRLTFTSKYGPLSYECATYTSWQGNLRAIGLTMESQRAMKRYGAVRDGQQYTGWSALPAGRSAILAGEFATVEAAARHLLTEASYEETPASVRAVSESEDMLRQVYQRAAQACHPDLPGGTESRMAKVNSARDMIEAAQAGGAK